MPAKRPPKPEAMSAASVAAALNHILTGYTIDTSLELQRQVDTSSISRALESFEKDMASIAAKPGSEVERQTASVAAGMASILSSFSKSFSASVAASLASLLTRYAVNAELEQKKGDTASVTRALDSFASVMASIAASVPTSPAAEFERLTASAAAGMASVLASFSRSLDIETKS